MTTYPLTRPTYLCPFQARTYISIATCRGHRLSFYHIMFNIQDYSILYNKAVHLAIESYFPLQCRYSRYKARRMTGNICAY